MLSTVRTREDLIAEVQDLPSAEIEAYATETLALVAIFAGILQERYPEDYRRWVQTASRLLQEPPS